MYDYSKLKGRITEKYDSQSAFAKALGIDDAYLSRLLNGKHALTQKIITRFAELLEIPYTEIGIYFFKKKVDEMQTL